jgi:hypothetical protein
VPAASHSIEVLISKLRIFRCSLFYIVVLNLIVSFHGTLLSTL